MATLDATMAELRLQFGPEAARRKLACMREISREARPSPASVRARHEWLLFVSAYPDNAAVLAAAESGLHALATGVAESRRLQSRLADTGIHGTTTTCSYSFDAVRWLADRFGESVEPAWDDGSLGEKLDGLLPHLACRVEGDALVTDRWTTRQWLEAACGPRKATLNWLLREVARIAPEGAVRDAVFDSLELSIQWKLDAEASRTTCRFPARPIFFHPAGLQRGGDWPSLVRSPTPAVRPLPRREAAALIDVGRCALLTRHRETDPMTHADPREVYLLRLERGVDVAIYGMTPARRLPIESFFGYVAARNRVPIAYGGGWVLGRRCEIGVNVFDTFRGGESAFVFTQILRAYRAMFDVAEFRVDPYQFGADNPEAIRSGAFWFYYRFGFRPVEPPLAQLAGTEASRIAGQRGYRTPASTLRRLARATMAWQITPSPPMPDLHEVGMALTRRLGRECDGDRAAAVRRCSSRMKTALAVRSVARWTRECGDAFERMAVLADAIPNLKSWPVADRRRLLNVMLAKGGPREREYAMALAKHARLLEALACLAGGRTTTPE